MPTMVRNTGATGGHAGTLGPGTLGPGTLGPGTLGPGTLALGALAAASAALAWYAIGYEIDVRPLPQQRPQHNGAASDAGNAATRAAPLTPRPLADYGGTLARPVFERSRRPRPAVVEPPAADVAGVAAVADELRVVGIMRARKGAAAARALVRSTDASQAVWVEAGASIGGWKVAAIGERTVTVEMGGQRREISLFAAAGADKAAQ